MINSPTLRRSIRTSSQRRKEEFNRALIGYSLLAVAVVLFIVPSLTNASTTTVIGLSLVLAPALVVVSTIYVAWRR